MLRKTGFEGFVVFDPKKPWLGLRKKEEKLIEVNLSGGYIFVV